MQRKPQDRYFDVFPKVLRVGKACVITIAPLFDNVSIKDDHTYELQLAERETYSQNPITPTIVEGKFTFEFTPAMEQEYVILLADTDKNGRVKRYEFSFYAVEEDIADLRPWKGDFHLHSCRSDGNESPLYVAGAYRQAGFDFMALTDHSQMPPSLEVIDAVSKLDTDFRVYPGEEVHPPHSCIHHINFGGSFSVNDLHRQKEQYEKELAEAVAAVKLPYLNEKDKVTYACTKWIYSKIRQAGGIGIFCHPFWITGNHFNVSEALQKALFEELPFDALEIYGGFFKHQTEANSLQVSRWAEERAKGKRIPVVGVSDSHGVENGTLFKWYYTLIFAPTTEFADLRQGILDERSVAVHAIDNEATQCQGSYRFVKYAYFVLREIMPQHDEECHEEGRQMLRHFAGAPDAAAAVAACKGRIPNLYAKLFA